MKKIRLISLILCALMIIPLFAACADTPAETAKETTAATETEPETTDMEITEAETYDPALDDSAVKTDDDGNVTDIKNVDVGLLVGTDGLGRMLLTNEDVGDVRENKTVGIFYSPWHGDFAGKVQAYNNQEILDKYPDIDINNFRDSRWGSANYNFWNEPIYGYYKKRP